MDWSELADAAFADDPAESDIGTDWAALPGAPSTGDMDTEEDAWAAMAGAHIAEDIVAREDAQNDDQWADLAPELAGAIAPEIVDGLVDDLALAIAPDNVALPLPPDIVALPMLAGSISKARVRQCRGDAQSLEYLQACGTAIDLARKLTDMDSRSTEAYQQLTDEFWGSAIIAATHGKASSDEHVLEVAKDFVRPGRSIASATVVAEQMGLYRPYVQRARCCAAAAAHGVDRYMRGVLERGIVTMPGVELLLYIDCARHDATTLSMKVRRSLLELGGVAAHAHAGPARQLGRSVLPLRLGDEQHDIVPAKIMQLEGSIAMLICFAGKYVHTRSAALHTLSCLEFGDSDTTHKALLAKSSSTAASEKFQMKVRAACTDSGADVLRAERLFHGSRPGWLQLNFPCKLHKVATCHTHTPFPSSTSLSFCLSTLRSRCSLVCTCSAESSAMRSSSEQCCLEVFQRSRRSTAGVSCCAYFSLDEISSRSSGQRPWMPWGMEIGPGATGLNTMWATLRSRMRSKCCGAGLGECARHVALERRKSIRGAAGLEPS